MNTRIIITIFSFLLYVNFVQSEFTVTILIFLTVIIYILFAEFFLKTNNKLKYFLSLFFLVSLLITIILPSVILTLNNEFTSTFSQLEVATSALITIIYNIIFLLFLNIGLSFKKSKYKILAKNNLFYWVGPKNYYWFLGIFFFILFALIRLIYPIAPTEFHNELRFEGQNKLGFAVSQIRWVIYIYCTCFSLSYLIKKTKIRLMVLILIYAISIAYCLFLGNRGDVFSILTILFALNIIRSNNKVHTVKSVLKYIPIIFLVYMIWQITTYYRNIDSFNQTDSNIFMRLGNFEILNYILFGNFEKPELLSFIKSILSPIPSTLNPFNSVLPDPFISYRKLGNAAAGFTGNDGAGRAVPLVAEMIWRFGLFFGLIVTSLFGFVLGKIFKNLFIKTPWSLLIVVGVVIPQFIFGEDFTELFWPLLFRLFLIFTGIELLVKNSKFKANNSRL